jgi:taurine dioxygenase
VAEACEAKAKGDRMTALAAPAASRRAFDVETIVEGFVARVEGLDIDDVGDALFERIYEQFLETPVLVLPGQRPDPKAFYDFTNRFGEVVEHVLNQYHHPDVKGVSYITNVRPDGAPDPQGYNRSREWHTDRSYDPRPGKTTALLALEMPSVGGATDFADGYRAYTALPTDLRRALAGKTGVFRWAGRKFVGAMNLTDEQKRQMLDAEHPILTLHPESGRPTIYADPGNLVALKGVPAAPGEAILQRLFAHYTRLEFQYAHRWNVGDFVIWDNRCSMHRAAGGYPPEHRRVLIRTQTQAR